MSAITSLKLGKMWGREFNALILLSVQQLEGWRFDSRCMNYRTLYFPNSFIGSYVSYIIKKIEKMYYVWYKSNLIFFIHFTKLWIRYLTLTLIFVPINKFSGYVTDFNPKVKINKLTTNMMFIILIHTHKIKFKIYETYIYIYIYQNIRERYNIILIKKCNLCNISGFGFWLLGIFAKFDSSAASAWTIHYRCFLSNLLECLTVRLPENPTLRTEISNKKFLWSRLRMCPDASRLFLGLILLGGSNRKRKREFLLLPTPFF